MKLQKMMLLTAAVIGLGAEIFAYNVTVQNATPFTVRVGTKYVGESAIACRPDDFELAAGHEKSVSSGGCLIKEVNATVFKRRLSGYMGEYASETEDTQPVARYTSTGRGDITLIVYGPIQGKFGITRLANEAGSLSR